MNRSGLFSSTNGKRKEFQTSSAAMMASAASPGFRFGRMTRKKVRNRPQPSIRAASSSSLGRLITNWRIRKTANGFTSMAGTISARWVSTQPNWAMSR